MNDGKPRRITGVGHDQGGQAMNDRKLILWDIDGTLMSCYNDGTKALNETFRRRTGVTNACGEIKVGTAMDSVLVDGIMEHLAIPQSEKAEIISEFAQILQEILDNNHSKRVLPGVREILDVLAVRNDVLMGLLTSNFKVGAEAKLKSVGLERYFSFGGYGDFPGEKWDAARQAIEQAEKIAGGLFKLENIYIIGDTGYDIICAKKIGVRSISVATGWMDYEELKKTDSDFLFDSFENTQDFFDVIGIGN